MVIRALIFTLIILGCWHPANAAPRVLRDTETENFIRQYATPIFRAAGLNPADVQIILVDDDTLNSFVAGGQNIFIHSGLILATKTPEELLGVIAHETGHIAGGHLVRLREASERASKESLLATVLGLAVGAAGGEPGAGVGLALGGNETTRRLLTRFTRNQETSADQAGLQYLKQAKISAQGLDRFLSFLLQKEGPIDDQQVAYIRTHPLTHDRLNAVETFIQNNPEQPALPADTQRQYGMIKAKLHGYIYPDDAMRRARADPSDENLYGAAMAQYKTGSNGLDAINQLLKKQPANPYFLELRGQLLFAGGNAKAAAQDLKRATSLLPDAPMIDTIYAQALLADQKPGQAAPILEQALRADNDMPFAHRLLATAYGQTGQMGLAKLHLAEEALMQQNYKAANEQAGAARQLLPPNTPPSLRAADIIAAAAQKQRRND